MKIQLLDYQNIVNKQPIYAKTKIDVFINFFAFKQFYVKSDSFYDKHREVTLSESIQGFSTKDIYIQQKAMFIITYIYQKVTAKGNCSYSQQKVLLVIELVESCIRHEFLKVYFLELYLRTSIRIFYAVIVYLFIYLFIHLFYLFIYFIYLSGFIRLYF